MRWTVTLRRTYYSQSIEVEVEAESEDEAREVAEAASRNGKYNGDWDNQDYPEYDDEFAEEAYAIEGSEEEVNSDSELITLANGEVWEYTVYDCFCEHANGTTCNKRPARWHLSKFIEGLSKASWLCDEHMAELEGKDSMESASSLPNIPSDLSEYLQQLEEAEVDN